MDKDLTIVSHTKNKLFEYTVSKRFIECELQVEINNQPITVSKGWQYIIAFSHTDFYRKTSFFLSEEHDKQASKEDFLTLILDHVAILVSLYLKSITSK